jgi:hypothetical protein
MIPGNNMAEFTDAERLDFLIENRAYVVSNPDICDGYWLEDVDITGQVWVYQTEHNTPREAIDAAILAQKERK